MLTLGTGNSPKIQFQTTRCTSMSIMGPAESVTATVTSVSDPGNNLPTTPHIMSVTKQHTDKC